MRGPSSSRREARLLYVGGTASG
ncbi:hypothetical protein GWK16_16475 [Roseomonas sp. JC162]|uniref:Uncharacterized protein n=1 Tax=Neoroseomonas marina TaxID=1232220 RepID=A0A848EHD9_9PROT|nr:hypothetical protein [Neoroseomonas marina]